MTPEQNTGLKKHYFNITIYRPCTEEAYIVAETKQQAIQMVADRLDEYELEWAYQYTRSEPIKDEELEDGDSSFEDW